jgi:hypothetical protein
MAGGACFALPAQGVGLSALQDSGPKFCNPWTLVSRVVDGMDWTAGQSKQLNWSTPERAMAKSLAGE